jgi:hypothetical protein
MLREAQWSSLPALSSIRCCTVGECQQRRLDLKSHVIRPDSRLPPTLHPPLAHLTSPNATVASAISSTQTRLDPELLSSPQYSMFEITFVAGEEPRRAASKQPVVRHDKMTLRYNLGYSISHEQRWSVQRASFVRPHALSVCNPPSAIPVDHCELPRVPYLAEPLHR